MTVGRRVAGGVIATVLVAVAFGGGCPSGANAPASRPSAVLIPSLPPAPRETGTLTAAQVLDLSPAWRARHDAYRPDPAALGRLRSLLSAHKGRLSVEVIFGAWCGDSLAHVPPFVKIQELVGAAVLPATLVGVDRRKREPEGRGVKYRIRKVPTFVVLRGGKEIGRIIETPRVSVEADLAGILARAK